MIKFAYEKFVLTDYNNIAMTQLIKSSHTSIY